MRVIHVLNHFLPYQIAGTEVYVWALCKKLNAQNLDVSILIPNYGSADDTSYEYDGLRVYRYAEPSIADRALITGQRLPDGLINFKEYLQNEKPAIIHFHEIAGSNGIGVAHLEAAKATGAKVVFSMHLATNTCSTSTLMYKGKELCDGIINEIKCSRCVLIKKTNSVFKTDALLALSTILFRTGINTLNWQNSLGTALSVPFQIKQLKNKLFRIEKACDKIVPITEWYHQILQRNGIPANKMKVILQALPLDIQSAASIQNKKQPILRLIFVGRIDEFKGVHLLIKAARFFTAEQIQIDIFGNAPDAAFLEKCKKETAAFNHINWMGKLEQQQVVPTISKYDALILPSTFSEMSPLVIQEAFAAGVPVIGSNVYGIAELVKNDKTGWLFQFNDINSLQNLLTRLVENPDMIQNCKAQLPVPTSFTELATQYVELYNDISI